MSDLLLTVNDWTVYSSEHFMPDFEVFCLLRICLGCGVEYSTSDGRSHYCGQVCAKAAKRSHGKRRQAAHRLAHPTREQARQVLKNAVLAGKVRRAERCDGCGELADTDGHHEDYSRPFFVAWLCRVCHSALEDGRHFGAGSHKPDGSAAARQAS